jgi:hypothetical protein
MGRTVPSFRMVIDSEQRKIRDFYGKNLENKRDRERLDRILNLSKRHSHACSEAVRLFPLESILMAVLLERQKIFESLL